MITLLPNSNEFTDDLSGSKSVSLIQSRLHVTQDQEYYDGKEMLPDISSWTIGVGINAMYY